MKVLIIGSGVIGVSAAYCLRRRGHEVIVLDRCSGPGQETSYANGGLLTPSMSQPWNTPGCWWTLLTSLVGWDTALQLRLGAIPSLAHWGLRFLGNSRAAAYKYNTSSNLILALYSREVLREWRSQAHLNFEHAARGALRIFRTAQALDQALATANDELAARVVFRQLSPQEIVQLEPALVPIAPELAGAIHYESDEVGDAHRYCLTVTELASALGVEFRFGARVAALHTRRSSVVAVQTDHESFTADRYIVAAGSYTVPILEGVSVHLPVRPAKGYSITFERVPGAALSIPVLDDEFHAAIVPLHDCIRVAGTAEFAGYDLTLRPARVRNLTKLLTQVLPRGEFDARKARAWCGLRAMSVDGVPIIGKTSISNLLVSTGHGHLGWTMAAGSAQLLADILEEKNTAIDSSRFSLARF